MLRREYRDYSVFVFDGDGVLWRGESPIPGAVEAVNRLVELGKTVVLLTNNSTRSRRGYAEKLAGMGFRIPEENIYTSSYGAALHLRSRGFRKAYVVGEDGLKEEVRGMGVSVTPRGAGAIVVGLDRNFTYRKLVIATRLGLGGAYFVATNRDLLLPVEDGFLPGAGSIVASVEAAIGRRADITIGKPETHLLEMVVEDTGAGRDEMILFGDRLDTDILAARRFGIASVLVLTGVHGLEDIDRLGIEPLYVLGSVGEIFEQ